MDLSYGAQHMILEVSELFVIKGQVFFTAVTCVRA